MQICNRGTLLVMATCMVAMAGMIFFQPLLSDYTQENFLDTKCSCSPQVPSNSWKIPFLQVSTERYTVTTPGVVEQFAKLLQDKNTDCKVIDIDTDGYFPAELAVKNLETECGWDSARNAFKNAACALHNVSFSKSIPAGRLVAEPSEIDIVIPSISDLNFLEQWKRYFYGFHLIIVQDGDPSVELKIPAWADYELYNRLDIEKALGKDSWIISKKDASIRNFGFLVSKKKYVYTVDDDCLPAPGINPVREHVRNLKRNSIPYFFNTLYDPFRPGNDFVRGYPYSLRSGVATVMSHGLWLNVPDYDAPTQLLKPYEHNTVVVDATQTIPKGVLYPMCSMNVAFDRALIGPAFMQGLMGEGQPWARYDDMFAGWASKVCSDLLGFGVKSGQPYIVHNKASNPFTNLKKEFVGLYWQEEMIRFFYDLPHDAVDTSNAGACYMSLAERIRENFSKKHPYFDRLATAMVTWTRLFENSTIQFVPSRKNKVVPPRSASIKAFGEAATPRNKDLAVFTLCRDESFFLPIWLEHYASQVDPEDIYVLDNDSTDGSTKNLQYHVINVHNDLYFDHMWLVKQAKDMQAVLLSKMKYKYVLFAEVDEMIVADPIKHPGGLLEYVSKMTAPDVRCTGYHVVHNFKKDPAQYNPNIPVLAQRSEWYRHDKYDKPLISNHLLEWIAGFHRVRNMADNTTSKAPPDPSLYLVHLHFIDHESCRARHIWKHKQNFKKEDVANGWGAGVKTLEELIADCDISKRRLDKIPIHLRIPHAVV